MELKGNKQQEGFSLIEVLFAIGLISIGILGFSVNTAEVIRGNEISGSVTIATNLAQAKLEELKGQTSWVNVTDQSDGNNPIDAKGGYGGEFTRTWTIQDSAVALNLKEISVRVSWNEYLIDREVVLATLVFTG